MRIYIKIFNLFIRCKNLICQNLVQMDVHSIFLLLSILIIIVLLYCNFIYNIMDMNELIMFSLSFVVSYLLTTYVLDRFTYSKNKFMRLLQKSIVFTIIIFIILFSVGLFLDSNPSNPNLNNDQINPTNMNQADIEKIISLDNNIISSMLEPGDLENPIEVVINCILEFNILNFIMTLILFVIIFNRIILQLNINTISSIANKYGNDKIKKWINNTVNKGLLYNNRFLLMIFIFNSIFIFIVSLFNIGLCYELKIHIHEYVTVYNFIHKDNSILLMLSLTNIKKLKK